MTTPRPDVPSPDVPLLAALDAGALDEVRAGEVRAAAESDPAAQAVLGALAATRAELAALPDPPVPPSLAHRWCAALEAEQVRLATAAAAEETASAAAANVGSDATPEATPVGSDGPIDAGAPPTRHTSARHSPHDHSPHDHPSHDHPSQRQPTQRQPTQRQPTQRPPALRPTSPRDDRTPGGHPRGGGGPRTPRRALLRRPAVLAGALLVAVLVGGGLLNARHEQLPIVDRPQLVAQGLSTVGVHDTGGLDDPARRAACLQAVAAPGVAPTAPLLGGRRVVFEGKPGVLLVLGTGRRGSFDIVVVDPACGTGGGTLLTATRVPPQ